MADGGQPPPTEGRPPPHRVPSPCDGEDDCLLLLAEAPVTLQECGSCHETSIYVHERGCECFGCDQDVCAHCHQHPEMKWGNIEAVCSACAEDCHPSEGVFWHPLTDDTVKFLCPLLLRACAFGKDDCPRKERLCGGCHKISDSWFQGGCAKCSGDVCVICHTHPFEELDNTPAEVGENDLWCGECYSAWANKRPPSVGGNGNDDDDDEFELPEDTCEDFGSECLLYEPKEPVTNRSCGACGRVSEYVYSDGCECRGCEEDVCVYCHGHPNTRYSSGSIPGGGDTDDAMCERCCDECDPANGDYWHTSYDPDLPTTQQPVPSTGTSTTKKRRREEVVKVEKAEAESAVPPPSVGGVGDANVVADLPSLEELGVPPQRSRRVAQKQTKSSDVHGSTRAAPGVVAIASASASASSGDASASSAAEQAMALPLVVKVEVRRRVVDDPAPVPATPATVAASAYSASALPESKPAPHKFMPPLADPDDPLEMSVQNLVFTGVLGTSVRLPRVVQRLAYQGAELNQKRFSAVIMRLHLSANPDEPSDLMLKQLEPLQIERPRLDKIAVLIFRNGNLVCTGAKTFAHARYMLLKTAESLRRIGYGAARIVRMNVRNMVGRAQLPCRIDRARMARELSAYVNYDPEQFPGAVVRHPMTRPITLLVFDSGRVVVTGTKCKARADAALARIKPLLVHFDVNTPPGTPMPHIVWRDEVRDRTLYDLLSVHPDANMKEIRAAFRSRARQLHPDKNMKLKPGSRAFRNNESLYKRTSRAYDILNDPALRDLYDRTGEGRDVGPEAGDDEGSQDEGSGGGGGSEEVPSDSTTAANEPMSTDDEDEDVDDEDLAMALEELLQEPGDD